MTALEELRNRAMTLPTGERAELAKDLLVSLDPGMTQEDVDAAWADVAIMRKKAFDAGQTTARDWRDSVARVQALLVARRASGAKP